MIRNEGEYRQAVADLGKRKNASRPTKRSFAMKRVYHLM